MLSRFSGETLLWILAYVAATMSPLAIVMLIDTSPGRGFWVEFSAALGFAGFVMLALPFCRSRVTSRHVVYQDDCGLRPVIPETQRAIGSSTNTCASSSPSAVASHRSPVLCVELSPEEEADDAANRQ